MKKNIKSITLIIIILIITALMVKPIIKRINFGLDLKGGFEILYLVEPLNKEEKLTNEMLTNTYKSIINRIDTLGVSEPEITIEGDKIRVKLPGVKDEESARNRLSTPAVLSFRDTEDNLLMTSSVLGGSATLDYDDTKSPVVALNIKDNDKFYNVTKEISKKENNLIVIWLDFDESKNNYMLEKENCGTGKSNCISAATVGEAFTGNVVIKGNFTREDAQELVDLINSGSLPTKLTEISTNTVDASFGTKTLNNAFIAGIVTLLIVSIIMIIYFRISGLISSICLFVYTIVVFLIFNLIDGVLTLPGIAALVLGIGMAIDSSIITLERIKEELRNGKSLDKAYKEGNKKALISLIDSNITTFLAAIILFIFGESSVKGFATMLMLTIIITIIVMIYLNRVLLNSLINSKVFDNKTNILIGKVKPQKERNYLKISKIYTLIIVIFVIIGSIFTLIFGLNKGVDFTGGTSITIKSNEEINKKEIINIIEDKNIIENECDTDSCYIKIKETLDQNEIKEIQQKSKEMNYSTEISVISNMVKKDLTKNAIKALIYATIGIAIYIGFRFTSSFAYSSLFSLLINVLIVVSLFTIFRIEINFIFIASILTIIGYSINDTIVIFDIIRENLKNNKNNNKTEEINKTINNSIKRALVRNILTSITTLSAVIILLILKTDGIYEFNMALLFGLTFGTFTSLLISTNLWRIFELKKIKKPKKDDDNEPEERIIKGINS